MNPYPKPGTSARDATLPMKLVLPRARLDDCIEDAWGRTRPTPDGSAPGLLWHAALTLQCVPTGSEGSVVEALVGPQVAGPPMRPAWQPPRPAEGRDSRHLVERPAPVAFALIFLAGNGEPPRDDLHGHAWDAWVAAQAPEHRLATPALEPDLLVLWLRADGLCRAVFRPGAQWRRTMSQGAGVSAVRTGPWWSPIMEMGLPGAEMANLNWDVATAAATSREKMHGSGEPAAEDGGDREGGEDSNQDEGRYSRLASALGPAVMQRLQACTVAVVGCGRAGSAIAHTLSRMGCSLLVLDPDTMSPHTLDGDLPALMEGEPKVSALRRQLRGLVRPGAVFDGRMLNVASPAAGALLAQADLIVCAADNDAAAAWADAWGLAMHKPRLVLGTGLHAHGAEADLRLVLPGAGCLLCLGGFSQQALLPAQVAESSVVPRPAAGERQRTGSLRSWCMVATHTGLRLLEHMLAGRIRGSLFRQLVEQEDGAMTVRDWRPSRRNEAACSMCRRLEGAGAQAVTPEVLRAVFDAAAAGNTASRRTLSRSSGA